VELGAQHVGVDIRKMFIIISCGLVVNNYIVGIKYVSFHILSNRDSNGEKRAKA